MKTEVQNPKKTKKNRYKIPLSPPFSKGELLSPPFTKGRTGGILNG
jgi:hypothetical protein